MTDHDHYDAPPLPPVARPTGARYFLSTWSGRLILVNALVFLYITYVSGSLFMPDTEALLSMGAKDPARLAQGEWWRLIAPIFIHIGAVHFLVNSYVLYVIGYQIERYLGPGWYLALYLISGIFGNIASAVFSVNLSAGASGAIFGLLGCGFYLERSIGNRIREATGRKPKRGAYAATVALNLAFGFLVPFIDNSAHIGGLVAGIAVTFAMVNLRMNRLQQPRRLVGFATLAALFALGSAGAVLGTSATFQLDRLKKAAVGADGAGNKIFHLSQALEIAPEDTTLLLERARLLFIEGEPKYALYDVRTAAARPEARPAIEALIGELDNRGLKTEAWQARRLLEHGTP